MMHKSIIKWAAFILSILIIVVLTVASTMPESGKPGAVTKVVIDAGHGGKDPGNLGTGRYKITEKTIALNVAKKVGKYIEEAFPDVEVMYTRSDDTFLPLHERTKFANTKGADIFISIHCDAFTKESALGAGSYVMGPAKTEANLKAAQRENSAILLEDDRQQNYGDFDPNSPEGLIELSLRQSAHIHQSLKFAKNVQDQFRTRAGRVDRGVRQAPYWVISFTTMPSVLIELGFLTNKQEEDFLISEQGQDYLSSAIYRAFKTYKTDLELIESSMDKERNETTKAPEIVNAEVNPTTTSETNAAVTFKVQLLSSSNKVACEPANFNGLEGVSEYEDNGMYKYLWGTAYTYEQAREMQKDVRRTGYKGAFVVAFDIENKRMSLEKALEAVGK
jgi:N-acetylmuramoyl-L-alanine amidase